jgi:hypothetical protein
MSGRLSQQPFTRVIAKAANTMKKISPSSRRRPGSISAMGTGLRRCDEEDEQRKRAIFMAGTA